MKWMLDVNITSPEKLITYHDKLFLIGSCFTEHIGKRLEDLKFPVLQNPHGILFDPISVSKSINAYLSQKVYEESDLFFLNELWQSWNHHSQFSAMDAREVLQNINASQQRAYQHLVESTWLIITLGSSYSYQLVENGQPVANCHRAPGQWFHKYLLSTEETTLALAESIDNLMQINPGIQIIFTISPVRHIRDGVVENNRSKARLIEAVHSLTEQYKQVHYFPAYELVIDVLRDYRYYDVDLVHPNYAATEFVFEKFEENFINHHTREVMDTIKKVVTGYKHKPFNPDTQAHRSFLQSHLEKVKALQLQHPQLNFSKELIYFSTGK